jgi:hypothetical protein
MHPESREKLGGYLLALRDRGDAMSMLVMKPRGTSDGLISKVANGELMLCYPHTCWHEMRRPLRFWRCALARRLKVRTLRWGTEIVSQADLGSDVGNAVDHVHLFFLGVYDASGPYALEFLPYGWRSSA